MTAMRSAAAIAVMSAVTVMLRFAPFLLLRGKETPRVVVALGKVLPYSIMWMLVVYCLKGVSFSAPEHWLPELIAGAFTVVSYVWKRSTLLSVIGGTVCYMLLVQLVFV